MAAIMWVLHFIAFRCVCVCVFAYVYVCVCVCKEIFPRPEALLISTIISLHPISFSSQSQKLFFICFLTIFLCSCERGGVNMGFTPKE